MLMEPGVILFAEDDPDHAELVRLGLEGQPFAKQVVHVSDGEAVLKYVEHLGQRADDPSYPRPHVVLLDLRLPKIDGLEVLRHLKSSPVTSTIPVVILTSSDARPDVERAYELRANAYLVKPIDFEAFSQLLSDLGLFWLYWNRTTGES